MKAVIQRVTEASVSVGNTLISSVGHAMLILLGIHQNDTSEDLEWLVHKTAQLRIFDDDQGVMNLDASQAGSDFMVISQFTLLAQTRKGNRPSYSEAMQPAEANEMVNRFIERLEQLTGKKVAKGAFGATMNVRLNNSGPVTIVIDSKNKV